MQMTAAFNLTWLHSLRLYLKKPLGGRVRPPASPPDAVDARSRRAFITEMLSRNPEAFSSDLDVQMMMSLYPDRY